jgi:hypothetical protein
MYVRGNPQYKITTRIPTNSVTALRNSRGWGLSDYNFSQLSYYLHKNYFGKFLHCLHIYYHTVFHILVMKRS